MTKRKRKKGIEETESGLSLSTPASDLTQMMIKEQDIDEFNKIKSLFDLSMKKKEIIRVSKLNDLQDLAVNEMEHRLSNRPGEFSNKDLITYFKAIQETIDGSNTDLDDVDMSTIKVVQNQVNININDEPELDRESKNRVIEAIRSIMLKSDSMPTSIQPVESEIIDCEDVS